MARAHLTKPVRAAYSRAGRTFIALLALVVLSAVFVGQGEAAGTLNGRLVEIRADYTEGCTPGTFVSGTPLPTSTIIDIGQTPSRSAPIIVTVSGSISGCYEVDTAPPAAATGGRMLIADSSPELFFYTTVTARTTSDMTTSTVGSIGMEVFPVGQDPADWPNNFPTSGGQAFIGNELVNYTRSGETFTIPTIGDRGQSGTSITSHPDGSLVRLQSRLKLVKRNGRLYVGYNNAGEPTSGIAGHVAGATMRSPKIQLTCRGRLTQTTVASANDTISSRSRCYAVIEPGTAWGSTAVADNAILPLLVGFFHELSNGTINDSNKGATQTASLDTAYLGISCFPFIENTVWSKITSTFSLDTNFAIDSSDDGEFRIMLYSDTCNTALPGGAIGASDSLPSKAVGKNQRVTLRNPADNGSDADDDGCSDYRELGTDALAGGLRDPFNKWDYFNPSHNDTNRTGDITAVAQHYGRTPADGFPLYDTRYDRGGQLGDVKWSFKPPNSIILTADITAAVNSYGHDCPYIP